MKNVELKLNRSGVKQAGLRGPGVQAAVEGQARSQIARLGEGYSFDITYSSKDGRVAAYIHPDTDEAKKDNLENNTLLKSAQG